MTNFHFLLLFFSGHSIAATQFLLAKYFSYLMIQVARCWVMTYRKQSRKSYGTSP